MLFSPYNVRESYQNVWEFYKLFGDRATNTFLTVEGTYRGILPRRIFYDDFGNPWAEKFEYLPRGLTVLYCNGKPLKKRELKKILRHYQKVTSPKKEESKEFRLEIMLKEWVENYKSKHPDAPRKVLRELKRNYRSN